MTPDPAAGTNDAGASADGPVRAVYVLEVLAGMRQPASLPDITTRTGLPRTKAYRALRALQDMGYVDHLGRHGYRIGSRAISLAVLIGPRPALIQRTRPVLTRLAETTRETATLHLRSGSHRVLVLGAEPSNWDLRHVVRPGERAPLTTGCTGTVILAHLPPTEAQAILTSRPAREQPTAQVLERIRTDGYAISRNTNHSGVAGIAAPLLDPDDGYPLGSLAIAGPDHRLPDPALQRMAGPLAAAARELAPQLAALLGRHASIRQDALDVTIHDFLNTPPPEPQ
ncbi:IclR family transcriptional regulator [Streptacidiphilus sp. PAMC 29251]